MAQSCLYADSRPCWVTHGQVGGAKQPGGEEQQGWDVLWGRGRGLVVSADTLIVSDLEGDLMGSGGL